MMISKKILAALAAMSFALCFSGVATAANDTNNLESFFDSLPENEKKKKRLLKRLERLNMAPRSSKFGAPSQEDARECLEQGGAIVSRFPLGLFAQQDPEAQSLKVTCILPASP